jgi:hypothetical protein
MSDTTTYEREPEPERYREYPPGLWIASGLSTLALVMFTVLVILASSRPEAQAVADRSTAPRATVTVTTTATAKAKNAGIEDCWKDGEPQFNTGPCIHRPKQDPPAYWNLPKCPTGSYPLENPDGPVTPEMLGEMRQQGCWMTPEMVANAS